MNPEIYLTLFFTIGLILGVLITFLLLRRNLKSAKELRKKLDERNNAYASVLERSEMLNNSLEELKTGNESLRKTNSEQSVRIAQLDTEKKSLADRIEQHTDDLKSMREQFNKDFQLLANKIFEEKSEKFTIQNRASLDRVLDPLKEKITSFQKKIEETHNSNLKETSGLRQELKHLKEMSQKMTDEAENLTRALKNDSKVQGNWGEMILENILENSGLRRDHEYFIQKSFSTSDGRRLQPDVLIQLPEDKCVIVDSKVSLKAYEQYISDSDNPDSQHHLKAHLNSLRSHIKDLSAKRYQDLGEGQKLDFILMFVPVEPAYLLALHRDQSLFNEAYDKHIVMVSPSTLIASLKIIASTWKHEYQNKNALEIAKRGRFLLEKFIGFAEDFEKIGEHLNRTEKTYIDAMKKLRDGRGSLVSQARRLEELGVKSGKKLSDTFNDDEEIE